ncbi:hypothetical protein HPB47_004567 [Ixodes persulcatus]|uniref:Uncharacterized protein n=1 Tax=Ixodes persulcatus TaxID=34615 RepID=A0AC60PFC6_IXOPE|nr:hypothetical protein HPB47_004567 [Ixodes persulcatus]
MQSGSRKCTEMQKGFTKYLGRRWGLPFVMVSGALIKHELSRTGGSSCWLTLDVANMVFIENNRTMTNRGTFPSVGCPQRHLSLLQLLGHDKAMPALTVFMTQEGHVGETTFRGSVDHPEITFHEDRDPSACILRTGVRNEDTNVIAAFRIRALEPAFGHRLTGPPPYATDGSLLSLARNHLDAPVLMSSLLSTTEGSSTYNPSTMPLNKLPPHPSSPVSLPPPQEATASTPSSLERRLCDKRLREICICFTGLGGTPAMGFAYQCRMFFLCSKGLNDLPTDAVLHSNPAHFKAFIEEIV